MYVNVAVYLDENYAVPATVMVRSLVDNAAVEDRVQLFVLSTGLTEDTKRTMALSWPEGRLDIHWIDLDWTRYERGFAPVNYVSKIAYARLLIDRCLPSDVERVITIDCDGVMLDDIGKLWRLPLGIHSVMAVRDPCVPQLKDDTSEFVQRLADRKDAPYFNSGLMVVDLKKWRQQRLTDRCLEVGERRAGPADFADQSLLNAVLQGEWEPLPLRWNCNIRHLAIHSFPSLRDRVYPFAEVMQVRRRPAFLHFLSAHKPWHATPFDPHREIYRQYLKKTAWMRDEAPEDSRRRCETAIRKKLFPLLCCRQAAGLGKKLGVPPSRLADLIHLLEECAGRSSFLHGTL
jgi:lipopolysaccharide biosynthesis glycosyltransferase